MVTRIQRPDSTQKLVITSTGPWRIVTADKVYVCGAQNIITGDVKDVHVIRLGFYVYKDLEMTMTVAFKAVFQHAFTQGEFEMAGIVNISETEDGQSFVTSRWTRLDSTTEIVSGSCLRLYGMAQRSFASRSCGS